MHGTRKNTLGEVTQEDEYEMYSFICEFASKSMITKLQSIDHRGQVQSAWEKGVWIDRKGNRIFMDGLEWEDQMEMRKEEEERKKI